MKSKKIIHIGCGAYPATAITLAKMNCKNIVAIDKNKRAVKLANRIINNKNLYQNITIEVGDGRTYPIENFDTIIISASSTPKIDVLDHIFKTAKPNSKIIIRELYETSEAVDDFINSHENIKLIKKIGNNSLDEYKWKSYYTVKLQ
jgi:precorrin-6B methylase 2